jgi:hypothetical protein
MSGALSFHAISGAALATALLGAPLLAHGQPTLPRVSPKPAVTKGTASVTGRVIVMGTGTPLRRARVQIMGTRTTGTATTLSGADGTFVFRNLAADRYQVRATKSRYVEGALGARRPGGFGRPVELTQGQRLSGVTIALSLGGVITGRVLDELGEPVANAAVSAMHDRRMPGGGSVFVSAGTGGRTTDDAGVYRVFGLAPGRYFVSVRAPDADALTDSADHAGVNYPPTFYPSTASIGEAAPVEVTAGAESIADVILAPARLFTVSGMVVDAAGRPARGGMATLRTRGPMAMAVGSGAGIEDDGSFTVRMTPPGDYTLNVHAAFGADAADRSPFRGLDVAVPLAVAGDVADVRVVVPASATVTGRMIYEGSRTRDLAILNLNGARGTVGSAAARPGPDGRFTIQVTPGARTLVARGGKVWMVKRLTWNGREVESGDEVEVDGDGGQIEAVFTDRLTTVTGTVVDAAGRPVQDYQVAIFPEDPALMTRGEDRIRTERGDQQGRFRTEGLVPGRYLVVAAADLAPEDALDPAFLETLRRVATPFRLAEGETQTLSLTLAPIP